MYINPFVAGVLATIGTECVLAVVISIVSYRRNKNGKSSNNDQH